MRRALTVATFMAIAAGAFTTTARAQSADVGRDSLRAGKYADAITILSKVLATDSQWVQAQRDLVRAYTTIGKYDEAEAAARKAATGPRGAQLSNALGEVLLVRGKRAPAESAFVRATAEHCVR